MPRTTIMVTLLAAGLLAARPALALETLVTQVDKNADGSMTYHFAIKTDPGETLVTGDARIPPDFVTLYNFYGLVDGSAKAPDGWAVTSEDYGRTPTLDGYPMVLPVDVAGTPNLTWTVTKPVAGGSTVEGFTATTKVATMVQGEYSAQVTRQPPAVRGAPDGAPEIPPKQAVLGLLPMPSFLAPVK